MIPVNMKKWICLTMVSILLVVLIIPITALAYPTKNIVYMSYSSGFDEYASGWEEIGEFSFSQSVYPGRNNSSGDPNVTEHTFVIEKSYDPDADDHHYRIIYDKDYFDMGTLMIYNPYSSYPYYMEDPDEIWVVDGDSGHPWCDVFDVDEGERAYICVWRDIDIDDYGHITIDVDWDSGYYYWEDVYIDGGPWHQVCGRNLYYGGVIPFIDWVYDFAVIDGFWVY